ncbi:hypothetical protein CEXT_317341, partial [Caerostris extrusa]
MAGWEATPREENDPKSNPFPSTSKAVFSARN